MDLPYLGDIELEIFKVLLIEGDLRRAIRLGSFMELHVDHYVTPLELVCRTRNFIRGHVDDNPRPRCIPQNHFHYEVVPHVSIVQYLFSDIIIGPGTLLDVITTIARSECVWLWNETEQILDFSHFCPILRHTIKICPTFRPLEPFKSPMINGATVYLGSKCFQEK